MPNSSAQTTSDLCPNESSSSSKAEGLKDCYFMVADLLGFSNMILNLNSDEQTRRIREWVALIQAIKAEVGVKDIQLISDTLFVREESYSEGLKRLLRFAQLLLNRGLDHSFPVRGAIVHGKVAWGELTYGQAVIQAHKLERSMDWVGIACSPNLPGLSEFWNWGDVVVYPVPRKAGLTQLMPTVSWMVPSSHELLRKVSGSGLIAEGDPISWEIVSKIERTIQFGMYLKIGRSHQLDPQHYRGWFPMHIIEAFSKIST